MTLCIAAEDISGRRYLNLEDENNGTDKMGRIQITEDLKR